MNMNEYLFANTKTIIQMQNMDLELLINTTGICRSHVAQSAVFPWSLPTPHEQVSYINENI